MTGRSLPRWSYDDAIDPTEFWRKHYRAIFGVDPPKVETHNEWGEIAP